MFIVYRAKTIFKQCTGNFLKQVGLTGRMVTSVALTGLEEYEKNSDDLPDIVVPNTQLRKLEEKYRRAKNTMGKLKRKNKQPSVKQKLNYKTVKAKYATALHLSKKQYTPVKKRKIITKNFHHPNKKKNKDQLF